VLEAERIRESPGHVATPAAARGLLEPDHVGVEPAERLDGHGEALVQALPVAEEVGGDAAVEHVVGEEAERAGRLGRRGLGSQQQEQAPENDARQDSTLYVEVRPKAQYFLDLVPR
jgi:hypothetical protein